MRKHLLSFAAGTVAALALVAAPLTAQARVGVIGGFVSSNITTSGTNGTFSPSSRSGFAAGVSVQGMLAPDLSLGPEAMYIEKGYKTTAAGVTGTFKLDYIEVPVLLRLGMGAGTTRLFVLGGPSIAFKIACSTDLSSGSGSIGGDCSNSTDNNIKSADFSVMFGAGVSVNALSLSARYDLGLTDVYNNTVNNVSYRNHALLILAGLQLGR